MTKTKGVIGDPAITINGFDDETLSVIGGVTHSPTVVGCYADGRDANFAQARADFPRALYVDYSRGYSGTIKSRAADYEPGCMDGPQLIDWMRENVNNKLKPIAYSDVSDSPTVVDLLAGAGIPRDKYYLQTAHDLGRPHFCSPQTCGYEVPGGADGTQWTFTYDGLNLDADIWMAYVFGPPPPAPNPFHYLFYATGPFEMEYENDFLFLNERAEVEKYDHLRRHPHMGTNSEKLNRLRKVELTFLRKRIWYVSHYDPFTGERRKLADWSNHRGWRWQEINKRVMGQAI
jgi:hypothetical protein